MCPDLISHGREVASAKTGGPLKPAGLIDAISGVFVRAGRRELPVVVSCRGQLRPYLIGDYSLESDSTVAIHGL